VLHHPYLCVIETMSEGAPTKPAQTHLSKGPLAHRPEEVEVPEVDWGVKVDLLVG